MPSVAAAALSVNPQPSAASLFPDTEAHEEALSATYQLLLARQMRIALPPRNAGGTLRSPIGSLRLDDVVELTNERVGRQHDRGSPGDDIRRLVGPLRLPVVERVRIP